MAAIPSIEQISQKLDQVLVQFASGSDAMPGHPSWFAEAKAALQGGDAPWKKAYETLQSSVRGDFAITHQEFDKGFAERLTDLAARNGLEKAYLELETDLLRMDDKGFARRFACDYSGHIVVRSGEGAEALGMRLITFTLLRDTLAREGAALPENPVMQEAERAIAGVGVNTPESRRRGVQPMTHAEQAKKRGLPPLG